MTTLTDTANSFEMHRRESDKMPSITAMFDDTPLYTRFYTNRNDLISFVMAFEKASGIVYNRTGIDPLQDKVGDLPAALNGKFPDPSILDYDIEIVYFALNRRKDEKPVITAFDKSEVQAVGAKYSRAFNSKSELVEFLLAFPNARLIEADSTESDTVYAKDDISVKPKPPKPPEPPKPPKPPVTGVKTYKKGTKLQLSENFSLAEWECNCSNCSTTVVDHDHVNNLQALRSKLGKTIHINSAYRCPSHNAYVGGVPNSEHVQGCATDIYADGISNSALQNMCEGFDGLGRYSNFTHIDSRGYKARWNG